MYLIFRCHSFKKTVNEIFCDSGTETRLSLPPPPPKKKRAQGLFRGRLRYGVCAPHCFRSAPSLQSRGGYKPSINTPRSDPTQLHLPSSPWLQALRNVEQIFRSRFPRFRVWLIAAQCMAARDHVPRIYPPTSILVVGLHLTPYSETIIALSVTTSLRSSKQSVEVGVYLRWFGRFRFSCIVIHRREKRITEFTYTESSTHWNQLYVKPHITSNYSLYCTSKQNVVDKVRIHSWRSWLRLCSTSQKVAGSIPDGVRVFCWLWSLGWHTHWQKWVPGISVGGKSGRCAGVTTVPSSCADFFLNLGALTAWRPDFLSRPAQGLFLPGTFRPEKTIGNIVTNSWMARKFQNKCCL